MKAVTSYLGRDAGMCRLCGASIAQKRIAPIETGQWLAQCGSCRAMYLTPDMTEWGLQRFYAVDYRSYYPFECCDQPDDDFLHALRCRETGFRRARALIPFCPPGGRVLEIGSGHGGFLGQVHRLRPDLVLLAQEPDEKHRGLALDGAEVTFLDGDALGRQAPFDLIVLFHTLEHLPDPVGELARLSRCLAATGILVAEVPATRPDALHPGEIHPAHLTYFTGDSLHRTALAAGLHPRSARAAAASLPDCLWLEASRVPQSITAPPLSAVAVAPARRRPVARLLRGIARRLLPPALVGRLSRWRHGPGLDHALAEGSGRLFRWGIPFDPLDGATLRRHAVRSMTDRQPYRVADINVAKLMRLRRDAAFRQAVMQADASVVDGMGVLWGLRLLGAAVPERLSGIDLLDQTAALCAEKGWRPFLLGARAEVLERAVARLCTRHPGLLPAGTQHGYFTAEEEGDVLARIAASGADCLIVALPYPRQDLFLARAHAATGVPFLFGVGGALDVVSGDKARAPVWMRRLGMEWLFRLAQEPIRLGPRYLLTNAAFLALLLSELFARRLARLR